jgi:small nuclear ribonucleoprotein (snRNP)-like protein
MSEMLKGELKKNLNKVIVLITKDGWAFRGKLKGFDEDYLKLTEVYETKTDEMTPGEQYAWSSTQVVVDAPGENTSLLKLAEVLIRLENVERFWFG